MDKKLLKEALIKLFCGLILIAGILFLSAGSFAYWNAWLLSGLLFIPMCMSGFVMMAKCPDLLRKRLKVDEKQTEQQLVIKLSGLLFVCSSFVVAGLNYRLHGPAIPVPVIAGASIIFLIAYACYGVVLTENRFLSRTVEIQDNQKVIDTGLYGIVRHPMYTFTTIMFLCMPIILGSWLAFAIMCIYLFVIVLRIRSEEELLKRELVGYSDYIEKTKYRLIPISGKTIIVVKLLYKLFR